MWPFNRINYEHYASQYPRRLALPRRESGLVWQPSRRDGFTSTGSSGEPETGAPLDLTKANTRLASRETHPARSPGRQPAVSATVGKSLRTLPCLEGSPAIGHFSPQWAPPCFPDEERNPPPNSGPASRRPRRWCLGRCLANEHPPRTPLTGPIPPDSGATRRRIAPNGPSSAPCLGPGVSDSSPDCAPRPARISATPWPCRRHRGVPGNAPDED